MTSYTLLWANETWEKYAEKRRKYGSTPIDYVAGDNKRPLSGVVRGDEIFVVTVIKGNLYVGGRLIVATAPLSKREASIKLGRSDLIDKELFLIANQEELDEFRPSCLVSLDVAKKLGLIKVDGTTVTPQLDKYGSIDRQAFRSPFKLTANSAETLRSILSKSPIPLRMPKSDAVTNTEPDENSANSGPVTGNAPDAAENESNRLTRDTENLSETEREAVVKVRFGQGEFRASLLRIAGAKCWMSGVEGAELLIASHIQPWAKCESFPEARRCPDNGLLLSSLWDAAFDSGLISFDEDWKVMVSGRLSESAKKHLGVNEKTALPVGFRNDRRAQFLRYHRDHVFDKKSHV